MIRTRICNAIALLALLPLAGPSPAKAQTKTPVVRERQENQKARIKEGVKDGSVTRREAKQLREEQKDIRQDVKDARADGVVTGKEAAKITREQNKASRDIYKQKNDKQNRK